MKKKLDIYQALKTEAFYNYFNKNDEYFYRKICRWFSKEFSTPLMQVYEIPWEEVLLNYYEHSLDNLPYNHVYDMAIETYSPETLQKEDEENEEFRRLIEERELKKQNKQKEQSLDSKSTNSEAMSDFEEINMDFGTDLDKEMLEP